MLKMGWIISPSTVKQAAFDLQQKETGNKTVAIATSKYASFGAFLSVQRACQIPIVLHHSLQRYSLLCVLTSILSHLMTSSVPNLHNTKILNISGTRWDMTKRKTPFFIVRTCEESSPKKRRTHRNLGANAPPFWFSECSVWAGQRSLATHLRRLRILFFRLPIKKNCEILKFDFFPSYLLVFSTVRILDIVVLHSQVQFLFLSTSYLIFSRPRILLFW